MELISRAPFDRAGHILRSKVTWCPSLAASRWGFKPGYLTAQLPEAARRAYTQSAAVGTAHPHPRDLPPRPCSIPKAATEHPSGGVCLSAFLPLPPAGSTISPSPCSLRPGFLLHPARFTLLFPPPLPLPPCSQAMFAFLSPAAFPLPPPGARSLLHPPREAAS